MLSRKQEVSATARKSLKTRNNFFQECTVADFINDTFIVLNFMKNFRLMTIKDISERACGI